MVLIHCWFWTTALEAVVPETILTVVQQGQRSKWKSRDQTGSCEVLLNQNYPVLSGEMQSSDQ